MLYLLGSVFYGLSLAAGLVVASFLLWKTAKKNDLPVDVVFDLTIVLSIFAITIGRLFFILEHFEVYAVDIFRWIHFIRYPGISAKGAFYGGILAGVIFLHFRKAKIPSYLDLLCVPVLYLQFFTGIGCAINGCVAGGSEHPLAWYYLAAILFLLILFRRLREKKVLEKVLDDSKTQAKKSPGVLFLLYLTLFGFANFVLESLFLNPLYLKNLNFRLWFNAGATLIPLVILFKITGIKKLLSLLFKKQAGDKNVQTTK